MAARQKKVTLVSSGFQASNRVTTLLGPPDDPSAENVTLVVQVRDEHGATATAYISVRVRFAGEPSMDSLSSALSGAVLGNLAEVRTPRREL